MFHLPVRNQDEAKQMAAVSAESEIGLSQITVSGGYMWPDQLMKGGLN